MANSKKYPKSKPVMNSKRKCPGNYIYRIKYKSKSGKNVSARCIRRPGAGPGKYKNWTKKQLAKQLKSKEMVIKAIKGKKPICKSGEILREGYVLKFNKKILNKKNLKTLKIVKPVCIKDRGLPGKWSDKHPNAEPVFLKKYALGKFGYHNVKKLSINERKIALKKAIKYYGPLTVWRKINRIYVLNRNQEPIAAGIFKDDKDWIRNNYPLKVRY